LGSGLEQGGRFSISKRKYIRAVKSKTLKVVVFFESDGDFLLHWPKLIRFGGVNNFCGVLPIIVHLGKKCILNLKTKNGKIRTSLQTSVFRQKIDKLIKGL
jgi:hypothetical protein